MLRDMVIDDRLALIEAVLDSKAVVGHVVRVEERKIGRTKHPFITLHTPPTEMTKGSTVWWRQNTKVSGEIVDLTESHVGSELLIEITAGMRNNAMPAIGAATAFLALEPPFPIRPKVPRDAPWTHTRRKDDMADDDDE